MSDGATEVYGEVDANIDSLPDINLSYDTKFFLAVLLYCHKHNNVTMEEAKAAATLFLENYEKESDANT